MLENLVTADKDTIKEKVNDMKMYGYRFAAMTCEKESDSYELTYHFDLNYDMKHIRITIKPFDKVKSISTIYPAAFLIENEYQDLYGFEFEDLIVDYKGNLYLTKEAEKTPMVNKK